jgi:D-arabinose 1-dehydrogenase-like Zn-dependent alcohol dehydrogenase
MQQRGYRLHAWGDEPVREEFPRPQPAEGEVLVEVGACGVGLTVLNAMNGQLRLGGGPDLLPQVPGHELAGRVTEVGPGVAGSLLGRRVVAYFYLACGTCPECLAGRDPRCARLRGFVGVHAPGGYAPWTVLPARNVIPVPEELDPVAATVVPDAVATPVHVCRTRAGVTPADRVAVIGAGGGVGAHMVQVAQLHGARVAGLEAGGDKLALVEELGAVAVPSERFDAVDPGAIWPDGRPTVVVDLLGTEESLSWAVASLHTGGRLVVLTTFPERSFAVEPRRLVFGEVSVIASRYAWRSEVAHAAELVASGRIRPVVGMRGGPEHLPAMHRALREGTLRGRGALVWQEERA